MSAGAHALAFQPVVDGTSLPQPPLDAIEAGNAEGVHLLVGTNRHEATLFNFMDPGLAEHRRRRHRDSRRSVVRRRRECPRRRATASRRADETNLELWTDIGSDAVFRIPAIRLAETQLAHGARVDVPVHVGDTGVRRRRCKACHALEIPFVFDTLDERRRCSPATRPSAKASPTRCTRRGSRSRAPATRTSPRLPEWPAYDTQRRATMRFDVTPEIVDDPMGDDRAAWGEFRR